MGTKENAEKPHGIWYFGAYVVESLDKLCVSVASTQL